MINHSQNPLKEQLLGLIKQARADLEKRFAKAGVGITPLQYMVLLATQEEPITINGIARHLRFRPPSILPAVNVLQKAKLLKRKNDPHDRRKIQLLITDKGLQLLQRVPCDDRNESLNVAFRSMSSKKQKQLLTLLQELTNRLSS